MWRSSASWLFPVRCFGCGAIGVAFCAACGASFIPQRRIDARTGLRIVSVGAYADLLRRMILAGKTGRRDVLVALAELLARHVPEMATLVPVPTSRARRRRRGYDQAEVLARVAARYAHAHVERALRRVGSAQQGKDRRERCLDEPRYEVRRMPSPRMRVTLIDDVCTTGATLRGAAAALARSGCVIEGAYVLALVPERTADVRGDYFAGDAGSV